jgi:hypothetical protein
MYDMTKGRIFVVFALIVAVLVGYVAFLLSGVILDFVLATFFMFFLIIGGALFYYAETDDERLFGTAIMAAATFIYVTAKYGLQAGIIALLILSACCLAVILWWPEE